MFILNQGDPDLAVATLMPVLLLMCYVSLKLMRTRKNKAYLFLLAGYAISLGAAFASLIVSYWQPMVGVNLSGVTFIVYGLYMLHRRPNKFMHTLVVAISASLLALPWIADLWVCYAVTTAGGIVVAAIVLRALPHASLSFFTALLLLSAAGGVQLIALAFEPPWAAPTGHWLAVAVFFFLFFTLFHRLVHMMQSSYVSSITDSLTGLYNRKYFMSYLRKCVSAGTPIAVLFSDIDNFKTLNDTKGHKAGDEALQYVAAILREEVEGIGIAGRFGGEEMVVCVTEPKVPIRAFAENVRKRIEQEAGVTASIGYTVAKDKAQPEEIVKRADTAMYRAKQTGKNKVMSYKDVKSS